MADVTERELYLALINSLKTARESCRGLGLKRGDMRWIKCASMMDQLQDNASKLFSKAQRGNGVIGPH